MRYGIPLLQMSLCTKQQDSFAFSVQLHQWVGVRGEMRSIQVKRPDKVPKTLVWCQSADLKKLARGKIACPGCNWKGAEHALIGHLKRPRGWCLMVKCPTAFCEDWCLGHLMNEHKAKCRPQLCGGCDTWHNPLELHIPQCPNRANFCDVCLNFHEGGSARCKFTCYCRDTMMLRAPHVLVCFFFLVIFSLANEKLV